MGFRTVELKFDNLWVDLLEKLLVRGESIDFLAKDGEKQTKVILRGCSEHTITDTNHTFNTMVWDENGTHSGHVTATFKPASSKEFLNGTITYHLYPADNMSESS